MPPLGLPIYGQESGLLARRWRTAAEREGAAAPEPGEFPEGAAEAPEGLGRRSFLKVLGASTALAGLQACQPPREPLVPYVRPPAGVTPSVPNAYATAASDGGYAVGLVVTSWEGRPTKIEGNPAHPATAATR
jgi:molybdopterin-containing oxidoreductase family iron-sulfur binding subunit